MLCNLHTHTTFCDGKNTAEEMVLSAIEKNFDSLGFSGHGHMGFDTSYCMTDTDGYIATINSLKEKYKDKIQIYLGIEDDIFSPHLGSGYDYVIGSAHYVLADGNYYAVDGSREGLEKALSLFDNNPVWLSEEYYKTFCEKIASLKPDIIGHYDLVTKYDEIDAPYFLGNEKYFETAEKYLKEMLKNNILFEVNTGAISRGLRTKPYPHERHLHTIYKNGGNVILSSDSHRADTLDTYFEEAKKLLKDIGFCYVYVLYNGGFIKDFI